MDREILFRGKFGDEWKYGYLSIEPKGLVIKEPYELNQSNIWHITPETVGQYTGLTDKNGKKIFEGDIVKFNKHIYQIVFEVGSFALLDKDGEIISKIGGINDHCYPLMELYLECCWEDDWAYDIEVIGNIHDNSEFLRSGS